MPDKNFEEWTEQLEKCWDLGNEENDDAYHALMYTITGEEDIAFLHKIIESIKEPEDYGLYEATFNAIWAFPYETAARTLASVLLDFQRRMGEHDQVFRFYLPIPNEDNTINVFVEEALKWSPDDKAVAIEAIKDWSVEDEDWEPILAKIGNPVPKVDEEPIPSEWPDEWKTRLEEWRKDRNAGNENYKLFWKGGKEQWFADFDFLLAALSIQHGKHWREIDIWTNPLWFYAKTVAYPEFVRKLSQLQEIDRLKVLENIKKVSKGKYETLIKSLRGLN